MSCSQLKKENRHNKSRFRFRRFNYSPVYYKKIPLEGALEISSKMMASSIHENLFKPMMNQSDLFADAFCNIYCSKSIDISKDITNEASIINKKL